MNPYRVVVIFHEHLCHTCVTVIINMVTYTEDSESGCTSAWYNLWVKCSTPCVEGGWSISIRYFRAFISVTSEVTGRSCLCSYVSSVKSMGFIFVVTIFEVVCESLDSVWWISLLCSVESVVKYGSNHNKARTIGTCMCRGLRGVSGNTSSSVHTIMSLLYS